MIRSRSSPRTADDGSDNLAVLLGLEFDAESARQRAIVGGNPPDAEPYVEPRDTRAWDEEDVRRLGDA